MDVLKITDFISEELISLDLKAKNKEEVLSELVDLMDKSENITDKKECYNALVEREKLGSTGIGKQVAIPHAKTTHAKKLTIGFGISKKGIEFDSLDELDTKIFFVFASPEKDSHKYLKILARISRLIRNKSFRKNLLEAETEKEILDLISEKEI
ncbi:MAG: PTS sugar transporter subunit IIA [Fusobacteriota bacterium]